MCSGIGGRGQVTISMRRANWFPVLTMGDEASASGVGADGKARGHRKAVFDTRLHRFGRDHRCNGTVDLTLAGRLHARRDGQQEPTHLHCILASPARRGRQVSASTDIVLRQAGRAGSQSASDQLLDRGTPRLTCPKAPPRGVREFPAQSPPCVCRPKPYPLFYLGGPERAEMRKWTR